METKSDFSEPYYCKIIVSISAAIDEQLSPRDRAHHMQCSLDSLGRIYSNHYLVSNVYMVLYFHVAELCAPPHHEYSVLSQ